MKTQTTTSARAVGPTTARARSTRGTLAALTVLATLAAPATLRAQAPADTIPIDSLVVTASRMAVPLEATSSAITVLAGRELRERGVTHVLDALREVPSLSVVQGGSHGATTSLFLRGGQSDYVKVLVDGVPINEPGGRADLANLSMDNIERIEIVRGPASVLYGSDAVSGVVQIFTRQGRGAPRLEGGARVGGYGTLAYDAELAGATDVVSYSIAGSRFETDGIFDVNNQYSNTTLSGRVRISPDARTDATMTVRYADSRYHYPTDGAGRIVDENAHQLEERTALALDIGRFLTDRLETRVLLTAGSTQGGTDDRPDSPADTLGMFYYRSQDDVRRRGADARANYYVSRTTVLTAGVAFEAQRQRSTNESDSEWGPDSGSFEADRSNRAFYVQALTDLGQRLALNAGARLDDNEAFGTHATWQLGAAWRASTGTRLRASAATAFKEPSFMENYARGYAVGDPDLVPEHSRSWEVALEQTLAGGRVALSATYFDQRFRDMIQYRATEWGSDEPNYVNLAAADVGGLELEARLSPIAALTLRGAYTYLDTNVRDAGVHSGPDAEYVEGDRLLRRPTHTASVGAAWRLGERGALHLDVLRIGARDDLDFADWPAPRITLPAYTRVDLGGEFMLLPATDRRPEMRMTLRVDNLLDAEYQEIVNFPARGRTVFVGARFGLGL